MFAEIVITFHWFTVILASSSCGKSLLTRLALEALALTTKRLEVVERTRCTWGKTSGAVVTR
jgi:hypothetical protein